MLALSRDLADGAHPYNVTPTHTAHAREVLGPDRLLIPEQAVVLSTDRRVVLERARAYVPGYLPLVNYRRNWERQGFTENDFADGGSDRFCDAVVAGGDVDAIRRRVQEHLDAGADHVVIQVLPEDRRLVPLAEWQELASALTSA
jgi:probable F420-dependent oxidoreductase